MELLCSKHGTADRIICTDRLGSVNIVFHTKDLHVVNGY